VAPLAHPAGDRAAKHEFYVGLEQPAVVCVLGGAEGRLARVGDAYPLAVADHVTLDVPHGFERLKSPGGGLRRGIESVAEGRTRHLRLGQAAGEPDVFQGRDRGRVGVRRRRRFCHVRKWESRTQKSNGCEMHPKNVNRICSGPSIGRSRS